MRQVVLDTETTGLDPSQGHKIVEIGCVEIEKTASGNKGMNILFKRNGREVMYCIS